jgi:hypothetical protein
MSSRLVIRCALARIPAFRHYITSAIWRIAATPRLTRRLIVCTGTPSPVAISFKARPSYRHRIAFFPRQPLEQDKEIEACIDKIDVPDSSPGPNTRYRLIAFPDLNRWGKTAFRAVVVGKTAPRQPLEISALTPALTRSWFTAAFDRRTLADIVNVAAADPASSSDREEPSRVV